MKKLVKSSWKYLKPNEFMFTCIGVFSVMAIITMVAMYRTSPTDKFNATLRYENLSPEQRRILENITDEARLGESDSNLRLAERVREASSIGLGLSVYLIRERVSSNRVLVLEMAMSEFAKSDLLPPACKVLFPDKKVEYGIIQTNRGIYYVRYSPAPLRIEVLSHGTNGLADGATFILRVPDTSAANMAVKANSAKTTSAGAWATIFEAPETENHYIPPAFAPVQTFAAMNWQIRPLQQTEMSPERIQELNNFLQQQQ